MLPRYCSRMIIRMIIIKTKLTVFDTAVTEISSFKREITKLTGDDIRTNFFTLPSVITVTFKIIQQ